MPYTYMLQCSDGSFYVGSTYDLTYRLSEHQAGSGAKYTKRRRPVTLVWAAEFDSIADAFWFEKTVQGWGREKRIALIEGRFEDLHVLAKRGRVAQPAVLSDESKRKILETLGWDPSWPTGG